MEKISYHSNIQTNDKRCINNYRPVSFLPICGKIFERILYNHLFLYLESNDFLTPHQSEFRPNDSCIYQLLSIVQSIYADFDHNTSLEFWGNFLDISKAFGKIWHEGLLYKLESIGISGNFLTYFAVSLMIDIILANFFLRTEMRDREKVKDFFPLRSRAIAAAGEGGVGRCEQPSPS